MLDIIEYRFIPNTPVEKKRSTWSHALFVSHEPDPGTSATADRPDVFRVDGLFPYIYKQRLAVVRTRRLEDVQFACLNPKQIARTRNATLLRRTRVN